MPDWTALFLSLIHIFLAANEKKQRQALIAEINDKGYKQVMDCLLYTSDKDMLKKDLRTMTGVSTTTMSRLSKDENVKIGRAHV